MIKDKKLKMELPETEEERMWLNLRERFKSELNTLEESIKPKNRLRELKKLRSLIKIQQELIKVCDKNLKK